MKSRNILIVSEAIDEHANAVQHELKKRGHNIFRLTSKEYSSGKVRIVFMTSGQSSIHRGSSSLPLSEIHSVWFRRPDPITSSVRKCPEALFAVRELSELYRQLYVAIPVTKWINHPDSIIVANRKFGQLMRATKLGFNVPTACFTNDARYAKKFLDSIEGDCVYKTLLIPAIENQNKRTISFIPTSIIKDTHIKKMHLLPGTGGIFQKFVQKKYDVRVNVFRNEVYASLIDSQSHESLQSRVDWRAALSREEITAREYVLSKEMRMKCIRLVKSYGLHFGAIDLIRSVDGKYYFLELNPNGQWLGIARRTKQPLIEAMCGLLTS